MFLVHLSIFATRRLRRRKAVSIQKDINKPTMAITFVNTSERHFVLAGEHIVLPPFATAPLKLPFAHQLFQKIRSLPFG